MTTESQTGNDVVVELIGYKHPGLEPFRVNLGFIEVANTKDLEFRIRKWGIANNAVITKTTVEIVV